jgi:NNP family nitrate/nitrite transporter-like MFS transporter
VPTGCSTNSFLPPLAMGLIYGWVGNYRPGLWLLSATALVAAVYTAWGMRSVGRPAPAEVSGRP